MSRSVKSLVSALGGCGALALVCAVYAVEPPLPNNNTAPGNTAVRSNTVNPTDNAATNGVAGRADHQLMTHTWRASQLEKMNVRNNAGEKIGAIEDLVVTPDGRVAYAALGFGGFLGMGEKLFAVPWQDLHMHRADANSNENYIVLNVNKDDLKNAPGFDKAHWPNFADPNFTKGIDTYYQEHRAADQNKVGQR